jgi:hypothetical protein
MVGCHRTTETDVTMHIQRINVPGEDVVAHHMRTREGERLCLLVHDAGNCHLFTYHEADRLAEVLRTRPVDDRLHSLARRVDELIGERGR